MLHIHLYLFVHSLGKFKPLVNILGLGKKKKITDISLQMYLIMLNIILILRFYPTQVG